MRPDCEMLRWRSGGRVVDAPSSSPLAAGLSLRIYPPPNANSITQNSAHYRLEAARTQSAAVPHDASGNAFEAWGEAFETRSEAFLARGEAFETRSEAFLAWGKAFETRGEAFLAWGKAFETRGKAFLARGNANRLSRGWRQASCATIQARFVSSEASGLWTRSRNALPQASNTMGLARCTLGLARNTLGLARNALVLARFAADETRSGMGEAGRVYV
jgi:hypothetical protein